MLFSFYQKSECWKEHLKASQHNPCAIPYILTISDTVFGKDFMKNANLLQYLKVASVSSLMKNGESTLKLNFGNFLLTTYQRKTRQTSIISYQN